MVEVVAWTSGIDSGNTMVSKNRYPENIMRRCRERLRLKPDDTSKDELINTYSPRKAFAECCNWEGFINWSDTLLEWVQDCYGIEFK